MEREELSTMARQAMLAFLATLFATLLLGGALAAETFVMKDGRRITGKIVREDRTKIVVRSGLGELELLRAEIVEIITKKTPREEYAERAKAAQSADDWYELGVWAQEQRLKSQAKKAFAEALELDAQHDGANEAVGNVRYKGVWMTPAGA